MMHEPLMMRGDDGKFIGSGIDLYLDAEQYIAGLKDLSREAVLEALGEAAVYCSRRAAEYRRQASKQSHRSSLYTVAHAIYVAKAKELSENDWFKGGFAGWCRKYRISRSTGHQLARIGAAPDPAQALQRFRTRNREQVYDSLERSTGYRPHSWTDPLGRIKGDWRRLSPEQRAAFLVWINEFDRRAA